VVGDKRRDEILERLRGRESATVEELSDLFHVSRMTIHRDLDRLAELRLVRKVRGGATMLPSTVFEADYRYRENQCQAEKRRLARAIADRIDPGMVVVIDDSSTVTAALPLLVRKTPLTVITNSYPAIRALSRVPDLNLIALGGAYDPIADGFFGLPCEAAISCLSADLAVFSTAAVRGTTAYLHTSDISRAKLAMKAAASRSIIAFDVTKFRKSALNRFCGLGEFDEVLIPDTLDEETPQRLRQAGVRLTLVAMDEAAVEDGAA
jgi:DeoR/GlpR family transcriptional regulator of sugar metabolism